jgi:branched chain amino acid efflux pump
LDPEEASETPPGRPDERGFRDGVRAVVPLSVAVAAFGITFGVLAREAGMGVLAPIVMSATTFAGSAQFAAVSILTAGGTVAAAVAAALLLNARYGPIGLSVARDLHGGRLARFVHSQLVVDESWAISADGRGRFNRSVLIAAGLVLYAAWVGGTVLGVFFGDVLSDPSTLGLDAAFPVLFLGLLWPQLRRRTSLTAAALGAGIAIVLTPVAPAGLPIVAAGAACLLGLSGWARDEAVGSGETGSGPDGAGPTQGRGSEP